MSIQPVQPRDRSIPQGNAPLAEQPDAEPLLAAFHGDPPPAPAWFEAALAAEPEQQFIDVEGGRIEALSWGDRASPGLLLLPGLGANAAWWRFTAPLLARDYHVATLSWSGMGNSDWRREYSVDQLAREAVAVAEATGLFDTGTAPAFVAHSFGAIPALLCATRAMVPMRALVIVDSAFRAPRRRREGNSTTLYPTLQQALLRFRFQPPQSCDNPYIVDFIARHSLRQVNGPDGGVGWTWQFDPGFANNLADYDRHALLDGDPACPVALVFGEETAIFRGETAHATLRALASDAPITWIPQARHHVMVDQPLALVAVLRALLPSFPANPL